MGETAKIDDLKPGPRHHRKFGGEILEMIDRIRIAFQDVYPKTLDEWVEGFDRDTHPEDEIAMWSHMAKVFERSMKKLPPDSNHDVLVALLFYSSGLKTVEKMREHENNEERKFMLSNDELQLVIDEWTV